MKSIFFSFDLGTKLRNNNVTLPQSKRCTLGNHAVIVGSVVMFFGHKLIKIVRNIKFMLYLLKIFNLN